MKLVLKSKTQDHCEKRGEFYTPWGLYILVSERVREPKPILQPHPLLSTIVAPILFSFYLLTYSQLGSLSSTTDARPAKLAPSPKRWDNPSPISFVASTIPLSGETFGADLVGLHDG